MFDRFTDRARKVTGLAREAAHELGYDYIGVEHFFVGLVREGNGVAANSLRNLGISPAETNEMYKKLFSLSGPTPTNIGQLPFTPSAKKLLEFTIEEASNLGHNYVGTEHLLLGLTRIEDNPCLNTMLVGFGVTRAEIREEVQELLGATMDDKAKEHKPFDPVLTLIKRRIESLSKPSYIEKQYGVGFSGPRLAVLEELKNLLVEITALRV